MTDETLDTLCRRFGIRTDFGPASPVPAATKRTILSALGVDPDDPTAGTDRDPPAAHPEVPDGLRCHLPDWLPQSPAWGLCCQLYELNSTRNWGIGDFRDLAELARIAAAAGADFLGINPVHALFLGDPHRRSPFMPSNRRFVNPLYVAPDALPAAPDEPAALATLRAADLVDYAAVATVKLAALRQAHAAQPFGAAPYDEAAYRAFVAAGGEALEGHALFEALSLYMAAKGQGAGWRDWPAEYHDHKGPAVARFARDHALEIDFQLWLQWVAEIQLTAAQKAARAAGMRIGIYLDLAVGEAPDGSATWSAPELTLPGLTIGAPPDVFAAEGQNWLLAAPSPTGLEDAGFAPFHAMLAAQMRHAGAMRIDHVMSLWQLFLVPEGKSALAGTHLRFPFERMLRAIAEASQEAGVVIIGEDLGWVPPGFRQVMAETGMLSYRILYFEQDHGLFGRSETYPETALACISTHDLPTFERWWQGDDIALRQQFGLIGAEVAALARAEREHERRALIGAFIDGGQIAEGAEVPEAMTQDLLVAAHDYVARTPCLLVGVRLADLCGPEAATNVPGTIDEYPNWQPRSTVRLDQIAAAPAFRAVTERMREVRPRRR